MNLVKLGILLILLGFALVFAGAILSAGNLGFGGLIMIGPLPIAFGSSPKITVVAMVIGLVLIFVFLMLEMMRSIKDSEAEEKGYDIKREKVKGGGVILIGPLPIVFGTDKRYALILMVLAIAIILLAIIFLGYINK